MDIRVRTLHGDKYYIWLFIKDKATFIIVESVLVCNIECQQPKIQQTKCDERSFPRKAFNRLLKYIDVIKTLDFTTIFMVM